MNCPSCGGASDGVASHCSKCGSPLWALGRGTVLAARYEIIAVLGQGGMGTVYKARDRELEETVAVKVLRADVASADTARRFKTEIKLARKVRHRNVCGIHEYGQDGSTLFISMEFIEGVDFRKILRSRRLDASEAFDVAFQVAEGLQAIHEAGIVHRDLKTPNLMRDARGVVRLMDFGIAKLAQAQDLTTATNTGAIVGTPEYMSPEQVRGQPVDARSDIYSLGIVLFELFTGEVPFRGETPVATILKHIQEPPPLYGPKAARVPPALVPVIEKALAKSPDERYATAHEMALAIDRARRLTPAAEKTWTEPETEPGTTALGEQDSTDDPTRTRAGAAIAVHQPLPSPPQARRRVGRPPGAGPGPRRPLDRPTLRPAQRSPLAWGGLVGIVCIGTWWMLTQRAHAPLSPLPPTQPGSPVASSTGAGASESSAKSKSSTPINEGSQAEDVPTTQSAPTTPPSIRQPPVTRDARVQPVTQEAMAVAAPPAKPLPPRPMPAPESSSSAGGPEGQPQVQTNALLAQAENDLLERRFDSAIALYDQVLKLEPGNQRAGIGRANAIGAKTMSQVAPPNLNAATRVFVQGETVAQSAETRADKTSQPKGFAPTNSVAVQTLSQPAALPGRVQFEIDPTVPEPGQEYKVRIYLLNEGNAPIDIKEVVVTSLVNNRRSAGALSPRVTTVAPRERALVVELPDFWRVEIKTWSMDALITTSRGESYKNQISWK